MSTEKKRILEMIQEGKITAEEGLDLIQALDDSEPRVNVNPYPLANRSLRIRVFSENKTKVNINVPLKLLKATSKFIGIGMKAIPEQARREMSNRGIDLSQLDIEELMTLVEHSLTENEKIVDIDVDDPQEGKVRVEIYVD